MVLREQGPVWSPAGKQWAAAAGHPWELEENQAGRDFPEPERGEVGKPGQIAPGLDFCYQAGNHSLLRHSHILPVQEEVVE